MLWNSQASVAGFPVEGLFTVYSRYRILLSRQAREGFVEEYVTRPRYTDALRERAERPERFFKSSVSELRTRLPDRVRHPLAIIAWALDCFAEENGRASWAAFDLHPEFRFQHFRRHIPGVKLAVMVRDPREAIAAALFWRGEPGSQRARDVRFKHCLIMYCLGIQTGRSLVRRWPDDVVIFDFNALTSGDAAERARICKCFGIADAAARKAYSISPHFSYVKGKGFLMADGEHAMLLTPVELAEISVLSPDGTNSDAPSTVRQPFVAFARFTLAVGRLTPMVARSIADLAYYPHRTVVRRINALRQLLADLRRVQLTGANVGEKVR